ncbi:hypothetical protein [Brevibacterium aurantiacum]|uniref:hypothetical protein n=1 Tax=Brevibacterium aurantiacum TaxID=273384 RepID=UPI0001BC2E29|nr:hypothetical protein [Brevibacterium aurantiacum]
MSFSVGRHTSEEVRNGCDIAIDVVEFGEGKDDIDCQVSSAWLGSGHFGDGHVKVIESDGAFFGRNTEHALQS